MSMASAVTIATDLSVQDICTSSTFNHCEVLDLRTGENGEAKPLPEAVLRRLRNFHVSYFQMPMDVDHATSRQENELMRAVTQHAGNVLVLADKMVPVARFCQDLDIPYTSRDLYLVETGHSNVPVQVAPPAANVVPLERLAV